MLLYPPRTSHSDQPTTGIGKAAGVLRRLLPRSGQGAEPEPRSACDPAGLPADCASFDLYVEHKTALVAAGRHSSRARRAQLEVWLCPIRTEPRLVSLRVVLPEGGARAFAVRPDRRLVRLGDRAECVRCQVFASHEAEEDDAVRLTVEACCGGEQQAVTLQVRVATAAPRLQLGQSPDKVYERPLQTTLRGPARFRLALANTGHLADRFELSADPLAGWRLRLTDRRGRPCARVAVGPVQGIFQWEDPVEIWLEAAPIAGEVAPRSRHTATVRARSQLTGKEDAIELQLFHAPSVWSVNDLDGLDPRPHQLAAGGRTSWVVHLGNPTAAAVSYSLHHEGQLPEGWIPELPAERIRVPAGGHERLTVWLRAPASAAVGAGVELSLTARNETGGGATRVRLAAEIYDVPKIYILVIDSLDYQYLTLSRDGERPGRQGDWLCPRIRALMQRGASFSEAHSGMPAATDMNHTVIASGAATGDTGAYWVSGQYGGLDEVGDLRVVRPSPEMMRYGPDGRRLWRIFDLVRERCPRARSVVVSSKAWVSAMHEDGEAVRWGITGSHFPLYVEPPRPYVLGAAPAGSSRRSPAPVKAPEMMVGFNPLELLPQILHGDLELLKPALYHVGRYIGGKPGFFPDDAWLAEATCEVIREEDPEVVYVNLAAVDEAGHVLGAAWDRAEWSRAGGRLRGRPVSKHSEQARRRCMLNVVREADRSLGAIVAELERRGGFDDALVIFAADHSMITEGYCRQGYAPLDLGAFLRRHGIIAPRHYGAAWSLNHYAAIFDIRDDETRQAIKRLLQGLEVHDPEHGAGFHPCIVLDREGMKSGRDDDNPYLPEAEKRIAEPLELYSSYYIDGDGTAAQGIRWPDLLIFFRGRYQATVPGDAIARGVNGVGERMPVFRRNGSRWVGIHGSAGTTHVPLLICGPGVQRAHTVEAPATLHDLLPTLCGLAGLRVPPTAKGRRRTEILEPPEPD